MSKKQGLMIALSALVAGFSVAGCSTGDSKDPGTSVAGDETTGKMGLNLTLSNGVLIEAFTATITGDAIAAPIVRTIPVPNNGATVSALFGGLPQGDYEIELAATSVDGNSQCGGSADFTVIAQQAVGVSVPITCNTDSIRGQVNVEGEFNVCPDVDFLFVAPLQTAVGGPISVEAHASDSDGDTITYAWTATDGEFDATDVASATYTCSAPGEQTITVAINDGGSCTTTHQAVVNCEPTAVCGDGNVETDKGEECDPPDGTTCSSTCQDIVVECGNGIVQPGEECDGGSDCNASCQEIECGDGRVDAPQESCDQPPRNGYELQAQGYLLGNCSACHNPRGFPSQKHPELRELLDFYPRKGGGGIFEFPLEATSPRVRRGANGDIEIPYISPSLYDRPSETGSANKCPSSYFSPTGYNCVEAPWRSLIWRNVDTPFTYADDYAIFPHMPRHGSNHDCRASRIVGDWMVSIPSLAVTGKWGPEEKSPLALARVAPAGKGTGQYAAAVEEARARIEQYHAGERYNHCPDTSDVQDPEVLDGTEATPRDHGQYLGLEPAPWYDGVPDRPHWVVLDNTEVPGDWSPRRADWADILLGEDPEKVAALDAEERTVVELLAEAQPTLSAEFRAYALKDEFFGFWKNTSGDCDEALSGMPTVTSLPPEEVPDWAMMSGGVQKSLYSIAPGAAVFTNICRNCHGPAGDGDSALAASIAEMTGGNARVANLRNGLLGPYEDPGFGRELVFGEAAQDLELSVDDLALRYLLWMALGGTQVTIPNMALSIVANTRVLGQFRYGARPEVSANMLLTADLLCSAALPTDSGPADYDLLRGRTGRDRMDPLISTSGDAELWMKLCNFGLRTPVRVLAVSSTTSGLKASLVSAAMIDAEVYGDRPVMTRGGIGLGVPVGEPQAWCVSKPTTESELAATDEFLAQNASASGPVPYCPEGLPLMEASAIRRYTLRGAMNAGMAAFVYLDALSRGEIEPSLQYDECHLLQ